MKNIYHITVLFFVYVPLMYGQSDSVLLEIQKMGIDEIVFHRDNVLNQKVISASQSLKEVKDLPFTIHVITKEEIIQNGYVTLVDALKMVPGVRVSQPGSALEGETFLMRGLVGNAYTKILINGIDIKPNVVSGMPIGAQLPIQQAERIEVIYGPTAALYGADASAGVINIIFKEEERPFFTQAHLSTGGNGYTNLNLNLGGKIGKDKNIFRFNVYANTTSYQGRNIIQTKEKHLFEPAFYADLSFVDLTLSPNFNNNQNITANQQKLPHLSRLVGFNLHYKSISLSVDAMQRRDHSAIGLNPTAVSHANPLNFFGERIFKANFRVNKKYKKWGFDTQITYLEYSTDELSSTTYIYNHLGIGLTLLNETNPSFDLEEFTNSVKTGFDKYLTGNRFSYAASNNIRFQQVLNFYPWKALELTIGATGNGYFNNPLSQYSPVNFSSILFDEEKTTEEIYENLGVPFIPVPSIDADVSGFLQVYYTLKKLNFIGGVQYFAHSNYGKSINPRIAFLYQIRPNFSIRGFYGTSFRRPPKFYETNNYAILPNNNIYRVDIPLSPERTKSFEVGFRWALTKKINADVALFTTQTKNLIFFNITGELENEDYLLNNIFVGYFNSTFAKSRIRGLQSSLSFNNIWGKKKLKAVLHMQFMQIDEVLPEEDFFRGNISEQPRILLQSRISFQPFNRIVCSLDNIYMAKFRNKGFDGFQMFRKYYTLDIQTRFLLNQNFQIYLKINNFFNNEYAGLSASGTIDDLVYNPQLKRHFRFGVNYLLN